ncbi:SURF1 family protein [Paraglaciecola sp. MB-3u-78]|uniref:SURF1 family protein n=1 Tax=Paraglaciecola sp. MB-3u-78 TaxID=2058332 RepID=UPI000C3424D8|nr:SURF1 family protein [Paraglaciecola sp. MB-3u-78]PKG97684.1 SURF1 family protein [Paraglaciecola sp. MB-3u-78]
MWNFISRLPFVATLVTFVCVVIMFALGNWQLQRAEQKTARLFAIEVAAQTAQVDLQQVLHSNINDMLDMPVNFEGTGDAARYFLLDNKIHKGRVGYQVLVPTQTYLGTVIVNFGWVAATNSREILPSIKIDTEKSRFGGVISLPLNNAMIKETALVDGDWPKVLQQTDLKVIQQHYKQQILPFVVLLNSQETSIFVRDWQPVVMAPEKHLAYAVQWFLLAFAALAIFVIAQRNKLKRNIK